MTPKRVFDSGRCGGWTKPRDHSCVSSTGWHCANLGHPADRSAAAGMPRRAIEVITGPRPDHMHELGVHQCLVRPAGQELDRGAEDALHFLHASMLVDATVWR